MDMRAASLAWTAGGCTFPHMELFNLSPPGHQARKVGNNRSSILGIQIKFMTPCKSDTTWT